MKWNFNIRAIKVFMYSNQGLYIDISILINNIYDIIRISVTC